jgi:hypothetical protein
MIITNQQPQPSGKQAVQSALETVLDPIKTAASREEAETSGETETIFDRYSPLDIPEEDPNEKCYWDKKIIKEKRELEQSVARMKAKSKAERNAQTQSAIAEQAALSAVRRGGTPGAGLGYYAIFK